MEINEAGVLVFLIGAAVGAFLTANSTTISNFFSIQNFFDNVSRGMDIGDKWKDTISKKRRKK